MKSALPSCRHYLMQTRLTSEQDSNNAKVNSGYERQVFVKVDPPASIHPTMLGNGPPARLLHRFNNEIVVGVNTNIGGNVQAFSHHFLGCEVLSVLFERNCR